LTIYGGLKTRGGSREKGYMVGPRQPSSGGKRLKRNSSQRETGQERKQTDILRRKGGFRSGEILTGGLDSNVKSKRKE